MVDDDDDEEEEEDDTYYEADELTYGNLSG